MAGGRPTVYTPEIVEKAKTYLEQCKDNFERFVSDNGKFTHIYREVKLPSVEGLSRYLGVARSTLYLWAKEYDEFSDIFEDLLAEQAQRLINSGLSGDYNVTLAKLMLSKHGYRESQDITTDGKALPTPILGAATKDESVSNQN